MGSPGTTLRERVAALEVECRHLVSGFVELKGVVKESNQSIDEKIDTLTSHMSEVKGALLTFRKNNGLTKKQRTELRIALITGFSAIVVAVISALPQLLALMG